MLSIQQLIKALRKLQASGNSNVFDLTKYLKNASATSSTTAATTTTTAAASKIPAIQEAIIASLLAEEESNTKVGAIQTPKQQKNEENENIATITTTTKATNSSQNNASQITNSATLSTISHSNVNGCGEQFYLNASSAEVSPKQQQDFAFCRNQQIQKFYQQQLLHFHTQQNSNHRAKQQQTQFAMSSLAAAAEPCSLKQQQQQEDAVAASNGDKNSVANTNGSSCHDGEVTQQGVANAGKPCFNTGFAEILKFMELIGNLKHTKRTGWVLRGVDDCESISGHMYRMSMMTFLLDGTEGLNQIRCMELALVHDLAESLVGDITPFCGISKAEKRAMEFKAMDDICKLIEPRGTRIMELFEEYEHGESPESKFVKDLDRLDLVMQAFEYEKRDNCLLKHQEFFDSNEGKFNHPFVKKLVDEIIVQRRDLAHVKGATPPPRIHVPDMDADEPAQTTTTTTASTSASPSSSNHHQENKQTSSNSS